MSDLQTNLKIIVGVNDLENRIRILENLKKIESKVGLATQKDTLGEDRNQTSRRNGIGVDQGGSEDGEKLLDGDEGKIGQPLSGLDNIFDCDTGQEIDLREDGRAMPPDGWESANNDPGASQWELGTQWILDNGPGQVYTTSTPYGAAKAFLDEYNPAQVDPNNLAYYDRAERVDDSPSPGQHSYNIWFTRVSGNFVLPVTPASCTPVEGSISCPTEYETPQWPVSDKFQLIRGRDGILRPHPLDPNVPSKYQDGVTTIDFCFGDGRTGRREATRDGGFMYYETDSEGGDAIGLAKVYDVNGVMVRNDLEASNISLYQVVDTDPLG